MTIIESPHGFIYQSTQENGDHVDCWACGNHLNDDLPIYTNHDGYAFCSEECILEDHDVDEELHAFAPGWFPPYTFCAECGDTEEGLMHNNTWRNIEPLLWMGE